MLSISLLLPGSLVGGDTSFDGVSMNTTFLLSNTLFVFALYIRYALVSWLYPQSSPSQRLFSSFLVCVSMCTKAVEPMVLRCWSVASFPRRAFYGVPMLSPMFMEHVPRSIHRIQPDIGILSGLQLGVMQYFVAGHAPGVRNPVVLV